MYPRHRIRRRGREHDPRSNAELRPELILPTSGQVWPSDINLRGDAIMRHSALRTRLDCNAITRFQSCFFSARGECGGVWLCYRRHLALGWSLSRCFQLQRSQWSSHALSFPLRGWRGMRCAPRCVGRASVAWSRRRCRPNDVLRALLHRPAHPTPPPRPRLPGLPAPLRRVATSVAPRNSKLS